MFSTCKSMMELSAKRRELIASGHSAASVNAAYNKAKAALISQRPKFRRPPSFTAQPPETVRGYIPYKIIMGQAPKNTIVISGDTVSI